MCITGLGEIFNQTRRPCGGTDSLSYDARDRLIESKDGNNKITYFKYDELDRVTETGEKSGGTYLPLAKTHYDNYKPPFDGVQTFVGGYGSSYPAGARLNVKGLPTVTATRILNPDGTYSDATSGWLYTTTYYNDQLNVIQTIKTLFDLGGNSYEHVVRQLRFDGRLEKELTKQKVSTGDATVEKQYTYDHADRLLSTRYIVRNSQAEVKNIVVAASRYDGAGQLKTKFLNSTDASAFRQQLDYRYIPRGWMSKLTGKTSAGDNFGIELRYANATAPQYNGNIGQMLWRGAGASTWSGYKFTYDKANRLTHAEGTNFDYSETVSSYDLNGNIKKLQRKKLTATWDDLTYDYTGGGNRLTKVTDAGSADGFNNGSSGDGTDYDYDGNGNLTRDQNRGLGAGKIRYNLLNLVREVEISTTRTMKYHYDATGAKLRMENGQDNTKYAGMFEYNSSNYLMRIATEEGQISIANNGASAGDYSFQYYLKDHLGNVRQVINEAGTLLQETEYFPFGLAIEKTPGTNKYLYNGIEKQPEMGIYLARFRGLDPAIGRWMQIDPKPDLSMSLYTAMKNNPIRYSDPLGDTTVVNNKGVVLKQYGGNNIIYQQGRKGKLTQIGEFGKSVNLSGILPNIMKDNKAAAKKMGAFGFANAVRPGGKWDYKDAKAQDGNIFGAIAKFDKSNDLKTSFTAGKLNFIEGGADVGNYNFGYTGRYVGGDGYSPVTLWTAAGVLQSGKDLIQGNFRKSFNELGTMAPLMLPPYGDESDDFIWTTTGMIHAENEKKSNN